MKQKDIALIAIVVIVSGVISFLLSGKIFTNEKDKNIQVEKVDVITSDFTQPNSKYFNQSSINPTQNIQIGNNENPNPFNSSQN